MVEQYQALRSVSDSHVYVICRDGSFYDLPDYVRHRGPWQGMRRGEIASLKAEYWLDLTEQGFVLLRTTVAAFQSEA